MDRWNIVSSLNYLENTAEEKIVLSKVKELNSLKKEKILFNQW